MATKHKHFEVRNGTYLLDGKEIDMDKDTKSESEIRKAIDIYKPSDGEYVWDPENLTFSPGGERAGIGDTGMTPPGAHRRTSYPVSNSADGVVRVPEDAEDAGDREKDDKGPDRNLDENRAEFDDSGKDTTVSATRAQRMDPTTAHREAAKGTK